MVLEVAGTEKTFEMAWKCARPNAIVTVVALYDRPQTLPLPDKMCIRDRGSPLQAGHTMPPHPSRAGFLSPWTVPLKRGWKGY